MRNRLVARVRKLQANKKKIFCAFVTLGYPSLPKTEGLIESFEQEGVDIVELGFPFSDPLADGPTIQYSSERALEKGVGLEDAFAMMKRLRSKGLRLPVIFFTYFNPVFHYGMSRFLDRAQKAGFDGLIVPDLPPDEEKEFRKKCHVRGLKQVFLVAPTTEDKRMHLISRASDGFIYYVSVRGVTGARKALPADIQAHVRKIKRATAKAVLIGFGVSTPKQAKELSKISDGVIVGSAIIESLRKTRGNIKAVAASVRSLVRAVKDAS